MKVRKPNHWVVPLIIAGITVGFCTLAYQFIFTDLKEAQAKKSGQQDAEDMEEKSADR